MGKPDFDTEMIRKNADYLREIAASLKRTPELLIVEDDNNDVTLLLRALQDFDVNFDIAHTATEAVAMIKAKSYDLIFLDLILPPANGHQVLLDTLGISAGSRFIVVTGYPHSEVTSRALKAGAKVVLPKPVAADMLALLFRAKHERTTT